MRQFVISRSSLREALKVLADHELITARPGIGWFVQPVNEANIARIHELAAGEREIPAVSRPAGSEIPTGPRRLPAAPEKPLHIPNLQKDRLGTFDFISWWEREKVQNARVLVVGAGALGNEVIKNLALMGVGYIYILDFDTIEAANLSRSPLFREGDAGATFLAVGDAGRCGVFGDPVGCVVEGQLVVDVGAEGHRPPRQVGVKG